MLLAYNDDRARTPHSKRSASWDNARGGSALDTQGGKGGSPLCMRTVVREGGHTMRRERLDESTLWAWPPLCNQLCHADAEPCHRIVPYPPATHTHTHTLAVSLFLSFCLSACLSVSFSLAHPPAQAAPLDKSTIQVRTLWLVITHGSILSPNQSSSTIFMPGTRISCWLHRTGYNTRVFWCFYFFVFLITKSYESTNWHS